MPAGRQSLNGDRLYRFSTNNGQRAKDACLIDAHGETTMGGPFALPIVLDELFFYTPPRTALKTASREGVRNPGPDGSRSNYTGAVVEIALETTKARAARELPIGGGIMCPNYNLMKINRTTSRTWLYNWLGERGVMSYEDIERFLDRFRAEVKMDIVTIRNRWFKQDLTLEEAVRTLAAEGYTSIHCSFCRVSWVPVISFFQGFCGGTELAGVPQDAD